MELLKSVAFSAVLLVCAVVLIAWHVRVWRRVEKGNPEPGELEYRRRQYRRRMLTSILLGVFSLILPVGHWIWIMLRATDAGHASLWLKAFMVFVGVLLLLVTWMVVLALADIWATKFFFGRLRDTYQLEQTRLRAELRRIQTGQGNGKANGHSQGPEVKGPDSEAKQ